MERYKDKNLSPKERAKELLKHMTVAEKVGQLNQRLYGFNIYEVKDNEIIFNKELEDEVKKYSGLGVLYGLYRSDPWSAKDFETGLDGINAIKAYNKLQKYVLDNSRLKIPVLHSTECPHGHQALGGYLLPVNLAMGATFNPKLVSDAYEVCGEQLKSMGVNFALISLLDILRDPRWGRSEECFGEDPYHSSQMAKVIVKAVQSKGVNVIAKHFAGQGECTGGINASAARIGERELREIHLPAMEACCEENVKGVMAAYNEIDGVYCHSNKKLLTNILRDEMGFNGVVMADGVAIDQLNRMTGDYVLSGAKALKAGVDISLWDLAFSKLEIALEKGLISMEDLDESVLRVLEIKFEQGLFENPYLPEDEDFRKYNYSNYDHSLQLAKQSVVLLKNEDNILPLKIDKKLKIAVIGPNGDDIYNQLGDYSPYINENEGITILKGIKNFIKNNNLDIEINYLKGCSIIDDSFDNIKESVELAKNADLVILALGGSSSRFGEVTFDSNGAAIANSKVAMDCGEGMDCANLELPGKQNLLAKEIFKACNKVISIIVGGRPYAITNISENTNALLYSFYPGIKGGEAIAEILFGKISPSGRLPVSIPRHTGQIPAYYNYKSSYGALSYYDLEKTPLYTFGDGLSYTKFEYSNIKLSKKQLIKDNLDESIDITVNIKNVGNFDGYTVLQLYTYHKQASTIRRIRELKNFEKVFLKKGEETEITISIPKKAFYIWNDEMQFVLENSEVELYLKDMGQEIFKDTIQII